MRKAEEMALKAYPKAIEHHTRLTTRKLVKVDVNKPLRKIYLEGYHQAEKDLALTWEDMQLIDDCLVASIHPQSPNRSNKEFYEEVLKRFNEQKYGK